jgi:hypothetical protein
MKRADWVLVFWIVLVPVMAGSLGFWRWLLSVGSHFGKSPAETLVFPRFWTTLSRGSIGMAATLIPAAVLAMVLLRRLRVRGVKPVPAIVLTVAAWCVLTVAMWTAMVGFLLFICGE